MSRIKNIYLLFAMAMTSPFIIAGFIWYWFESGWRLGMNAAELVDEWMCNEKKS